MSGFHEVLLTCEQHCPFRFYRPGHPEAAKQSPSLLSEDLYEAYYAAKTGGPSPVLHRLAARDMAVQPSPQRIARREHDYRVKLVQHTPNMEAVLVDLDSHAERERRIVAVVTRQPACLDGPSLLTAPDTNPEEFGTHRYRYHCGVLALQSLQLRPYEYGSPPYLVEQTDFGQTFVALVRSLREE